jgi:hypothetical protein
VVRSTLAKAFGLKRGPLSDTTWQPLPTSMLKLLVQIADAEKQFEANRAGQEEAYKDRAPASCSPSRL